MLIELKTLIDKYSIKPTGVLHVGANKGEERFAYRDNGINNVIWIEADNKVFELLKENIKYFGGHYAINACIGDVDGKVVTFNIANNEGQSSSVLEFGTHAIVHPETKFIWHQQMKTIRLDTLLNHNKLDVSNYDFVNMDLQGFELPALKGMGEMLHKANHLYLEVNKAELYKGCALIQDIDAYVAKFGFTRKETEWCGNTNWGDAYYGR